MTQVQSIENIRKRLDQQSRLLLTKGGQGGMAPDECHKLAVGIEAMSFDLVKYQTIADQLLAAASLINEFAREDEKAGIKGPMAGAAKAIESLSRAARGKRVFKSSPAM